MKVTKHGSGRAYWSVQGKYYSTEQKLYQQGTLSLNLTRDYFKLMPTTKDGQIVYRLDPLKGPVAIGRHARRASGREWLAHEVSVDRRSDPGGHGVCSAREMVIRSSNNRTPGNIGIRGVSSTMIAPPFSLPNPVVAMNPSICSRWSTREALPSARRTCSPCTSRAFRPPATCCICRLRRRNDADNPWCLLEIKGRLFLGQWVGNFLLMLLAAGWLQVPDSHAWQFLFSSFPDYCW